MREFIIGANDAGRRLDRFTESAVPLLPGSLAQKYIRKKRIKVGGKGSSGDYKLTVGDTVQMYINDEFFETSDETDTFRHIAPPDPDIIYEDDNILLVNKKAGVVCQSGGKNDGVPLIQAIQAYLYKTGKWQAENEHTFRPALCNRIDRNTSGIVIAAKNANTLRIINEKIKLREIDKYYLAAVHGSVTPEAGRMEDYIFKDAVQKRVYVSKSSRPGAKTAVTDYKTVAKSGGLTLLECRLITGRTHQIRAQLAYAGYPLLGDGKYGSERKNKTYGEKYQALCSYKLTFSFKTDAGMLGYLNKQTFTLSGVDFAGKYFPAVPYNGLFSKES